MARRSVLLLVAVLIALAGTAMIVLYVQGIDARATKDQELVEVLVAAETIDTGESVSDAQEAGKIEKAEVRRADLVDGGLSSTSSISDLVAIGTIYPGEQLIAKKFGSLGDTQGGLVIPDDKMAVSVELTDFERVAGFVNPGNEVAVFATALDPVALLPDNKEQKLGSVTRIVLTRVPVLGVGTTSVSSRTTQGEDGATTEEVARTILTIAVTQDEAEKLLQADRTSELNFALLTEDTKISDQPGARLGDVFPELNLGRLP